MSQIIEHRNICHWAPALRSAHDQHAHTHALQLPADRKQRRCVLRAPCELQPARKHPTRSIAHLSYGFWLVLARFSAWIRFACCQRSDSLVAPDRFS